MPWLRERAARPGVNDSPASRHSRAVLRRCAPAKPGERTRIDACADAAIPPARAAPEPDMPTPVSITDPSPTPEPMSIAPATQVARKTLSIVTGSFNEEGNVDEWFNRVLAACARLEGRYEFEFIWIDNASEDGTVDKVSAWCERDARVKLIVNARNFGPIRSPFHAMMQAGGDACVYLASDLQDLPEMIVDFVAQWERGFDVVAGVYRRGADGFVMRRCRRAYYEIMGRVSDSSPIIQGFTGFGLYSRRVLEHMRQIGGPNPLPRALVAEIGLPTATVTYDKPARQYGATKNDLLMLIDQAVLGLTSMSKAPVRIATITGLILSAFGFLIAAAYLVAKLLFWNSFPMGQAPLLIGIFLFASVQILIMGLIGEYVAAIHLRLQRNPWVVEKRRVNFGDEPPAARRDF
jgi:glycosyltransferase involved in cell wall biosynthesis